MKLLIILIIAIIIVYCMNCNKVAEHFVGYNLNDVAQYPETKKIDNRERKLGPETDAIKNMDNSIYIEGRSNILPGYEENYTNAMTGTQWIVKSKGYSDIFNYEDDKIDPSLKITGLTPGANIIKSPEQPKKLRANIVPPETFVNKGKTFTYYGIATNKYYEQYYLIYERDTTPTEDKTPMLRENSQSLMDRYYEYILIKRENNKFKIIHEVNPRTKISYGTSVYFSYGAFELGPLKVENIKLSLV